MPVNPLDIYGDYADGYSADVTAESAYHFDHPDMRFNLQRLPLYPEYELLFEQAKEQTGGGNIAAYEPYAQELIMRLNWPRMAAEDRANLETFFKTAAQGMTEPFLYTNLVTGHSQPVRFAEPVLAAMPEVAYEQHQVSIALRVDLNYPQLTAIGTPNPALTGNRFVLGNVAMPLPAPLRPATGYDTTRFQPLERDTTGGPVIYEKSRIMRLQHTLAMILNYDQFVAFLAFFFSFAHGQHNRFSWYDQAETSRVMRLSGTRVSVKQQGYNRYAVNLPLIEEIGL